MESWRKFGRSTFTRHPRRRQKVFFILPDGVKYLGLTDLLIMKLTSFRLKDQVHVQDLLMLKLITKKVESALPADLQERLQYIKDQTKRER